MAEELPAAPENRAAFSCERWIMPAIERFAGEHRFLSNFHPSPIWFEGVSYPTVEHAYQAAKSDDFEEKLRIASVESPGVAKRLGRRLVPRRDWEECRVFVMEELVRAKFARHADLRRRLLDTGDAELIEGNNWCDRFWGVCGGVGENRLGRILMQIREEFCDQEAAERQDQREPLLLAK